MGNTSQLFWGLIFGSVGLGFFVYGRKQRAVIPLVCGVTLMVYPYFVSNTIVMVLIGAVLCATPFLYKG